MERFLLVLVLVIGAGWGARRASARGVEEQVIALTIADGTPDDPGRVFSLPVECNGVVAQFELGCFGTTRISSGFARRVHALVLPDADLSRHRAPDGKPIFAGSAVVTLALGGMQGEFRVSVMRDEYCQKPEKTGLLGYDAIRAFQWEVDPSVPSLTLRPLGTAPKTRPLAILPLHRATDGAYVTVRIRNVTQTLGLMPGSSFVQAGPELQRAWDFSSGKTLRPTDMQIDRFGDIRTIRLYGDDVVELGDKIHETNLLVALIGDPKHPRLTTMQSSGLGQCVLNRFVYCVDARRGQLRLMSRVAPRAAARSVPTSRPIVP